MLLFKSEAYVLMRKHKSLSLRADISFRYFAVQLQFLYTSKKFYYDVIMLYLRGFKQKKSQIYEVTTYFFA